MTVAEERDWPLCRCGNEVDPRRVRALDGVVRCMECPPPPPAVFMLDVSKSTLSITSDPRNLIGSAARPGMTGRSDPSSNGTYMKLESKR